jgi:putative serine protease PepD
MLGYPEPKGIDMNRVLAIGAVCLAAVAAGLAAYAAFTPSGSKTVVREVTVSGGTPTSAAPATGSVTSVYDQVGKGVVEITVTEGGSSFGGTAQAQGSGFVYDSAGHIVTDEHVVDGATSISVKFPGGAAYKATVVGTDASTDLAVIKVNAPASVLHPIQLADSSQLQVGQQVVAIGSPYGLEESVTAGVISALHREMTAPNNFTIPDSIQTDAAINHGNSGGPLLDLAGRVVGVNAQIKSDSGDNSGVGFAIPSNTVRSIVSQLITKGDVQHAYLGVSIAAGTGGVALTEVRPGTPAERAGLQQGDVITSIDGQKVSDPTSLSEAIDAKQPGDKITLTYLRDGETKTTSLTLATRPS